MNYPKEVWNFIADHESSSIPELSLKLSKTELPKEFIINQVNGRQKAKKKFPFLLNYETYIFPPQRALEQASSEETAQFKSEFIKGNSLLDLSGGMGIDAYFLGKAMKQIDLLEPQEELLQLTKHNLNTLGLSQVEYHLSEAESFLKTTNQKWDCVYVDPDRRSSSSRFFKIEDCRPNILELLPKMMTLAGQIWIKLSPMLDLDDLIKKVSNCRQIYIISVNNECKEILCQVSAETNDSGPIIQCINLKGKERIWFTYNWQEQTPNPEYSDPLKYLYEPNASVMKSQAYAQLADKFKLKKLAKNAQLFTSNKLESEFPGRILEVTAIEKPSKKVCNQANVVSRNFPMKPEQIRKKYQIKEGQKDFCYATTLSDGSKKFILARILE